MRLWAFLGLFSDKYDILTYPFKYGLEKYIQHIRANIEIHEL